MRVKKAGRDDRQVVEQIRSDETRQQDSKTRQQAESRCLVMTGVMTGSQGPKPRLATFVLSTSKSSQVKSRQVPSPKSQVQFQSNSRRPQARQTIGSFRIKCRMLTLDVWMGMQKCLGLPDKTNKEEQKVGKIGSE